MSNLTLFEQEFEKYPQDTSRQLTFIERMINEDVPMLESALQCYRRFCETTNTNEDPEFLEKFVKSWSVFTLNALSNVIDIDLDVNIYDLEFGGERPVLYVFWHFPAYPLIIKTLLTHRVIAIGAEDAEWMRPLAKAGLTVNFKTKRELLAIRQFLKKEQSMAIMLDYWYQGTRHRVVDFLGRRCRTPSGLVELALKSNYQIKFVTLEKDSVVVHDICTDGNRNTDKILNELNDRIGKEVISNPSSWLFWASLGSREVTEI